MFKPWGEDVLAAIDDRHTVCILDYDQPIVPQFEGINVVIDHGGRIEVGEGDARCMLCTPGRSIWRPEWLSWRM